MQPHQLRAVVERDDLVEKTNKLGEFLRGDVFRGLDPAEQERLKTQHSVMCLYGDILYRRIVAFGGG